MPYRSIGDLPPQVRNHLPTHAQMIFRSAFNSALREYGSENRAFPVAWSAVKQMYVKNEEGKWVPRRDTGSYRSLSSGSHHSNRARA